MVKVKVGVASKISHTFILKEPPLQNPGSAPVYSVYGAAPRVMVIPCIHRYKQFAHRYYTVYVRLAQARPNLVPALLNETARHSHVL